MYVSGTGEAERRYDQLIEWIQMVGIEREAIHCIQNFKFYQ